MLSLDRSALCMQLRRRGVGDDAEDLVQDLWLKAARLSPARAIGDPEAYLGRMAANLARDHLRASRRRSRREQAWSAFAFDEAGRDEAPLADRRIAARQVLRAVAAILAALDERSRAIFLRFRVEGASQAEIAAEEGMTVSGVQKRLHHVYRLLEQCDPDGQHPHFLQAAGAA